MYARLESLLVAVADPRLLKTRPFVGGLRGFRGRASRERGDCRDDLGVGTV